MINIDNEASWKIIDGCSEYSVNIFGHIKNNSTNKILKEWNEPNRYSLVSIKTDTGKKKSFRVHQLVARTFIPNPNNYPIINHKDENKHNNYVGNLEWCTYNYNNNYGTRNKCPPKIKKEKPKIVDGKRIICLIEDDCRFKKVIQYTMDFKEIDRYNSIADAERKTKVNNGNIVRCCKGIYSQSGGFIWRYEN